ncbi:LCP family protein [Nocardioides donggukensis]|uniref:LCP family protein n=1 Tax=Nocardioides donggukensis TaxID=2774019 RepID=A0A927Q015_9ACTN|nr:LCP family protein [Nocardioides donggukensis]MBD8868337.1 LCP family protein [Nocardioides donggukensis]
MSRSPDARSGPEGRAPAHRPGFVRRHLALSILAATALTLTLAVGGWVAYLQSQLVDVPRFEVDLERPGRPAAVPGDAVTLLLAGVDVNQGRGGTDLATMLESGAWEPGSYRSDAIMVLHIEAGARAAQLVSIPRDSYVPVAGRGSTKINAALSAGGPALLARTVEDLIGIRLDHVVLVDYAGFTGITRLLGGVEVTVAETVHDPKNDKTWQAGRHVLEGEEALLYVRQRYGLGRGDFDRVQRQQNFLRALLGKATGSGVLANPVTLTRFVRDLSDLVAVDSSLTPGRLRSLALDNRRLRGRDLRFLTVPHLGTATIGGASVVLLDRVATREMFAAVAVDDFAGWARDRDVEELPPEDRVR